MFRMIVFIIKVYAHFLKYFFCGLWIFFLYLLRFISWITREVIKYYGKRKLRKQETKEIKQNNTLDTSDKLI